MKRSDGIVLGFTDHDRNLTFDGIQFEANAALNAEAIESSTGLSVDTHSVTGALNSVAIADADIERGLYDGAEVTVWLADWRNPTSRLLLSRGHIGEIRRGGAAFEAEIVGLAERLNQSFGRAFMHDCGYRLGETKCGVDLTQAAYRASGTVQTLLDIQQFTVDGLAGFADRWFSGGALVWETGANAGTSAHVKVHSAVSGGARLELWLSPPLPVAAGDTFTVTAGCDKTIETCKAKFSNLMNFGGFPHLVGDDFASSYVTNGGQRDGGSLYRS